jgi:hypothetical protein
MKEVNVTKFGKSMKIGDKIFMFGAWWILTEFGWKIYDELES